MSETKKIIFLYIIMAILLALVGLFQSWNVALAIFNLCLISAIMTIGVNIQWGYAGIVNFGMMGFTALGGLAAIIISMAPVEATWAIGGKDILLGSFIFIVFCLFGWVWIKVTELKFSKTVVYLVFGLLLSFGAYLSRLYLDPAIFAVESYESAKTGYLGGLGFPILFSWAVGGLFAALAAYLIGKISLGLRSDYLAIATLGISEIIIYVMKNEDWLTRGVKNVNGIPRPVPYELDLQKSDWFINLASFFNQNVIEFSSIAVKVSYAFFFGTVLIIIFWFSQKALNSPWGRMMRAIRDNETAANAMGKDIKFRHLQVFVLGSAVIGIAGAMLTTLDGQFTPASYQPLRFTFVIWIMVIVGGSGNNFGSILGGFLIWFFWVEAEPLGLWFIETITFSLEDGSPLKIHLMDSAAHMRLMTMGAIMLLVLRFAPKGLIPERKR